MIDIRRIRKLLTQVQQPPDDTPAEGLSESECDAFEQRTGIRLPNDLRQWLGLVNGPCIGPGGLYGIHTRRSHLDMEGFLARFPQWRASKWIPVAGDGCGNHYVVATRHEYGSGDPELFVDTSTTPDAPSFIVSSDIGHFIVALLEQELGSKGWPFDKVYVTKADPAICEFYDVPLPWTAD